MVNIPSNGIAVAQLGPALSMADLMAEASTMAPTVTDLGGGIKVERRGAMIKVLGGENLSPSAMTAAFRCAEMGGEAGRAMFDTFRKANPTDFDGSRTFAAILRQAEEPAPAAPRASTSSPPTSWTATVGDRGQYEAPADSGAVAVKAGAEAKVTGSAAGDFIETLYRCTIYGLDGNDHIQAGGASTVDGGKGDDHIAIGELGVARGGDGNDVLFASGAATLMGGEGDDRLESYGGATLDGGLGDDVISGYEQTTVLDAGGDNFVSAYAASTVATGGGDDWIQAYDQASVTSGGGADLIEVGGRSRVSSGEGDDFITAGHEAIVSAGAGDDLVTIGRDSVVAGGAGNDRITVQGKATLHFQRGDGDDIVGGGSWGGAYSATDRLSSSVVAFGPGITAADLSFERKGNDLLVTVAGGGGSITLKDVQRHGTPSLTFADGTVLESAQVAAVAGPAEEYRPASRTMQNWVDACAVYRHTKAAEAGKEGALA